MAQRWSHNNKILLRGGPLAPPGYVPNAEEAELLQTYMKVLVIGAGGLGCELLKDLALCGFRHIHVIDMDTIDLSNLNRQFLFRHKDIGRDKATVAAEFINQRVAGAQVVPHFCPIQEKGEAFYRNFHIVVCGLDSIAARRWINNMLLHLLRYNADGTLDESSMIPLIDGGTEGFKGNARVIFPGKSACIECMLSLFPPQVNFPMCTIANTPRLPEHCIEYAKIVLWPKERSDKLDGDDPEHITWIYNKAMERAATFGIKGITYRLTQGVVKRIIPNVASTSAVIAAMCANEAWKIAAGCCKHLENYVVFNDVDGVYSYSFEYERNPECIVCSGKPRPIQCSPTMLLKELIQKTSEDEQLQLSAPGFTTTIGEKEKTLYLRNPPFVEKSTRKNLDKSLQELGLVDGSTVFATDSTSPASIRFLIVYDDMVE